MISYTFFLGIMTLHDGMILSTLSLSSHDFVLGFPKGLKPMEMYSLLINPGSFPKLVNVKLPPNNPPIEQSTPFVRDLSHF